MTEGLTQEYINFVCCKNIDIKKAMSYQIMIKSFRSISVLHQSSMFLTTNIMK